MAPATTSSRTTAWWRRTRTRPLQEFSTFDAAGTVGGPIVRDRAWFFGSYRRLEREDDVTSLDTDEFLRTVKNTQDQGYAKGTWTPTRNDTVSFTFLNDPTDISGRRDRDLTNARDRARVQGGDNYSVNYLRLQGPMLIEGGLQRAQRRGHGPLGDPRRRRTRSSIARPTSAR